MGEEPIRVAVVHDWLVTQGGAEKVLRQIVELFPEADIYTLVDFLDEKQREEILLGKKATPSFIQYLPLAKKYFRNYLPLFPKAIESFDLSQYDLIISSSWAFAKGVKKTKNQKHICYCHTPIRYAWDLYEEYVQPLHPLKKWLVIPTLAYIRKWDRESAKNVDLFIANSTCVAQRIQKHYTRDATILHPPVDCNKFRPRLEKEDFYLTLSRLVPYKKTRFIVEAFNEMPQRKLVVIGEGEELTYLKKIAKNNVEILGFQPDSVVVKYMQKAKAFVYAAKEDFGIVMAEALSSATPVIAFGECGARDIVCNGCGVLFAKQKREAIMQAVEQFEKMSFSNKRLIEYALQFDQKIFKEKLLRIINENI
ncbi:glycosyl transferase [Nitratiruptor sp. YY08-26]|uniref:glycosyltransferase n=1 Tax=unclassified Nitratiruptor TaxID=2624044 RepID=UPI001914FCD8|nr:MULTISPECIES: glycosyltransferase [unclassified Nitratiruptor]BCD62554.1 glycosyl transferase [Nitratiruptor sp. YY08-13]BCD66490.1 glycosyl transferase [Nitratiruptor sp. YY08-26]